MALATPRSTPPSAPARGRLAGRSLSSGGRWLRHSRRPGRHRWRALSRLVLVPDVCWYPAALRCHQPVFHGPGTDLTRPLAVGLGAPWPSMLDRRPRLAGYGDVPASHLVQLTGVSLTQIYLIVPAVQAKADRLVGGLGLVEVIDQGHGYVPHGAVPLLLAGTLANQPRVVCAPDCEPIAVTLFAIGRLVLFSGSLPAGEPRCLTHSIPLVPATGYGYPSPGEDQPTGRAAPAVSHACHL